MATELEAKIKITKEEAIGVTGIMNAFGGIGFNMLEVNTHFDNKKSLMSKSGQALRIRKVFTSTGSPLKIVVTHKGPVTKGLYKSREENEFSINGSAESVAKTFSAIGYDPTFLFEKRRVEWTVNYMVDSSDESKDELLHVCLDEIPLLGFYVEVEGPTEETIREMLKKLGMDGRKTIKDGYPRLLKNHLDEIKDTRTEVKF